MASGGGYTLKLNPQRVNVVIGGDTLRAVRRAAFHTQRRARANVKRAGRIDTGKMMMSIQARKRLQGGPLRPRYYIQTGTPYSVYQELGTRGSQPVTAKALRFKPKGSGSFVFAMRTRPVKPAYFMRDAYRSIVLNDFVQGGSDTGR